MVTSRVMFYRTTLEGQELIGSVTLDSDLHVERAAAPLADILFKDINRSDYDAVLEVMRLAPERFDGAYLRASFEGEVTKSSSGLEESDNEDELEGSD